MKKEIIGYILYKIGKFFTKREKFLSIYFHDPSPELFEQIVLWLKRNKYRVIDMNECYDILSNKREVKERVAYLSFDDGWKSNLELISIIEKYNIPITIFVATAPIESGNYWWEFADASKEKSKKFSMKSLKEDAFYEELAQLKAKHQLERSSITEEELIRMSKHPLISIQSHTINHPILINSSQETLDKELVESKKYLEDKTQKEVFAFSYPNGDFGNREVKAVENAGYKIAFTTKATKINTANIKNLLLVPRKAINTYGGKYENLAKVIGTWQFFFSKAKKLKNIFKI